MFSRLCILPRALLATLSVGITATLLIAGALFFEFIIGLAPCPLCLWQRVPHVLLAFIASTSLLIFLKRSVSLKYTLISCLTLALISTALGVYHAGVEWGWWLGPSACGGTIQNLDSFEAFQRSLSNPYIVNCAQASWRLFGLSLAGYNALISAVLIWVCSWGLKSKA